MRLTSDQTLIEFFVKFRQVLVIKSAAVAVGILRGIVLARGLGPAGRGILAIAETIRWFALVGGLFGHQISALRELGRDSNQSGTIVGNAMLHCVVGGTVTAAAVFVLIAAGVVTEVPTSVALMTAVSVPTLMAMSLLQCILFGMNQVGRANWLYLAFGIVNLVFILLAAYLGILEPAVVLLLESVNGIAIVSLFYCSIRKTFPRVQIDFRVYLRSYAFGTRAQILEMIGIFFFR
jgi:O-antigen/teichoic acid export membrane protein